MSEGPIYYLDSPLFKPIITEPAMISLNYYQPGDEFILPDSFAMTLEGVERPLVVVLDRLTGTGSIRFHVKGFGEEKNNGKHFLMNNADFCVMARAVTPRYGGLMPPNDESVKVKELDVPWRFQHDRRVTINQMPWQVCGFIFDLTASRVVLIEKKRPAWQAGKYNGVGGKIKGNDETPASAMSREALEECGVNVPPEHWRHVATCRGVPRDPFTLWFFCCFTDQAKHAKTLEDERVRVVPLAEVPATRTIYNLQWLIPLCLDETVEFPVTLFVPGDNLSLIHI